MGPKKFPKLLFFCGGRDVVLCGDLTYLEKLNFEGGGYHIDKIKHT